MTDFKRRARRHQAAWRAARGFGVGEYPKGNPNGSVLAEEAGNAAANFLSGRVVDAVEYRLHADQREKYQTLDEPRLRQNLLSSMPMCFNLFGELHGDLPRLTEAGRTLWRLDQPGKDVRFEWSPGRAQPAFTNDRTAFDVALIFGVHGGPETVIGIETKYHEHAIAEAVPDEGTRLRRYREIAEASTVFKPNWERRVLGTPLQQIWRDHLLLLSMLQHPDRWHDGKYVLVYPAGNTSFAAAAKSYLDVLETDATFQHMTLEELVRANVLHQSETQRRFRERYLF